MHDALNRMRVAATVIEEDGHLSAGRLMIWAAEEIAKNRADERRDPVSLSSIRSKLLANTVAVVNGRNNRTTSTDEQVKLLLNTIHSALDDLERVIDAVHAIHGE